MKFSWNLFFPDQNNIVVVVVEGTMEGGCKDDVLLRIVNNNTSYISKTHIILYAPEEKHFSDNYITSLINYRKISPKFLRVAKQNSCEIVYF